MSAIAAKGNWVEGEIYLGIDPLFYFKELHARPGMPALQYDWRIKSILLETPPRLSIKNQNGGTTLSRDESRQSFVEVADTPIVVGDDDLTDF